MPIALFWENQTDGGIIMRLEHNRRDKGSTLTDYVIVLALVAIASIAVVGAFGTRLKDVAKGEISALAGENSTAMKISVEITDATLGDFASAKGGNAGTGDANKEGGSGGGAGESGAQPGEGKNAEQDNLWEQFRDEVAKKMVEGAVERYDVTVNQVFKSVAEDMHLTQEIYEQMVQRAAKEFALGGELASVNAMEALQDVRSTLLRAQDASKAVQVFEVLETGVKVVGTAVDVIDFGSEMYKAANDPAHQFEHEGRAVGGAAGAVLGAGLISVTAPVSVPVLIVGVVGAALLGVLLKPIGGYFGSIADDARAKPTIVKRN